MKDDIYLSLDTESSKTSGYYLYIRYDKIILLEVIYKIELL